MQNDNRNRNERPDDQTSKSHDRQGIDKTPGEETAGDLENVVNTTQRGKNKVDGDPSQTADQPLDQE